MPTPSPIIEATIAEIKRRQGLNTFTPALTKEHRSHNYGVAIMAREAIDVVRAMAERGDTGLKESA